MTHAPSIPGDTFPALFWNAVARRGDKVALRQKELGIWRGTPWRKLGETARAVGLGLVRLGFEPGETASVLANTRREWLYADLGVLGAGGVCSGIYPTDAAGQVLFEGTTRSARGKGARHLTAEIFLDRQIEHQL